MSAAECPRAGRLFGGCKFNPRYDVGTPADNAAWGTMEGAAGGIALLMEAAKPKTYVRDVCERCGKTVERS